MVELFHSLIDPIKMVEVAIKNHLNGWSQGPGLKNNPEILCIKYKPTQYFLGNQTHTDTYQ